MRLFVLSLLLFLPLVVSCSPSPCCGDAGCADAEAACLQGKATVVMNTSRGEITIEVDGDAALSRLATSLILFVVAPTTAPCSTEWS
ncbi:MAG: hypothetical protein CM15mP77_3990 [Synechococcus sp.]|nr:MAG: hypothetical protein CM15mP77_3990 [Synechococcus sp.]